MTSLFSRLQKLNKEALDAPWHVAQVQGSGVIRDEVENNVAVVADENAELIVECRNSLPAVLNLIGLLRRLSEWDALAPPVQAPFGDGPYWKREIDAALEPFIEEHS